MSFNDYIIDGTERGFVGLEHLKEYLDLPEATTKHDEVLMFALISATARVTELAGNRVFFLPDDDQSRKFTRESITPLRRGWFMPLDEDLYRVTSITIDAEVVASTDYQLLPVNESPAEGIHFLNGVNRPSGEYGIQVSGRWCYSETPPRDVQRACLRLAAFYYRERSSQEFQVIGDDGTGQRQVPQTEPAQIPALLAKYRIRNLRI